MFVFIPTAIGRTIPAQVIDSIKSQTEPVRIVQIATTGCSDKSKKNNSNKWGRDSEWIKGEARSRNEVVGACSVINDDMVVMQDDDCVHLHTENIKKCSEYLRAKPAIPYLAIKLGNASGCKAYPECLRIKCIVARKDFLSKVTFWPDSSVCTARQLEMQAKSKGLSPRYYQSHCKMIEEVRSTK